MPIARKLTTAQAIQVIELHFVERNPIRIIAERFDVSYSLISALLSRKTYPEAWRTFLKACNNTVSETSKRTDDSLFYVHCAWD